MEKLNSDFTDKEGLDLMHETYNELAKDMNPEDRCMLELCILGSEKEYTDKTGEVYHYDEGS